MILAYDPNQEQPIKWGAEMWGKPGHNVHVSSSGSWLESEREER